MASDGDHEPGQRAPSVLPAIAFVVIGVGAFLALAVAAFIGAAGLPALLVTVLAAFAIVALVRRRRHGVALAVAIGVIPIAAGTVLGSIKVGERIVCEQRERRVLREIQHLSNAPPSIEGDLAVGGCTVRYTTPASVDPVSYYGSQLGRRGWVISNTQGSDSLGELLAERGDFTYRVWWSRSASGTRLAVSVHD